MSEELIKRLRRAAQRLDAPRYASDAALLNEAADALSHPAPARDVPEEWRKLAADADRHLTNWLDADECDCENGHICGRNKVMATRDGLRAMLAAAPKGEE
ncbi:MAG: hypothetical protein ABFE07_22615 [Armatimonadia bacterium]